MESIPRPGNLNVGAFGGCAMREARIPTDGDGNRASVFHVNGECVFGNGYPGCPSRMNVTAVSVPFISQNLQVFVGYLFDVSQFFITTLVISDGNHHTLKIKSRYFFNMSLTNPRRGMVDAIP